MSFSAYFILFIFALSTPLDSFSTYQQETGHKAADEKEDWRANNKKMNNNNEVKQTSPIVQYVLSKDDLRSVIKEIFHESVDEYIDMKNAEDEVHKKNEKILTSNEVTEQYRVSKTTLWRWDRCGFLPAMHVGTRVLYKESDVIKALENK